jgi:hypothetical protein
MLEETSLVWHTIDVNSGGNFLVSGAAQGVAYVPEATDDTSFITAALVNGATLAFTWAKYYRACAVVTPTVALYSKAMGTFS